jgi:hypothetical protein
VTNLLDSLGAGFSLRAFFTRCDGVCNSNFREGLASLTLKPDFCRHSVGFLRLPNRQTERVAGGIRARRSDKRHGWLSGSVVCRHGFCPPRCIAVGTGWHGQLSKQRPNKAVVIGETPVGPTELISPRPAKERSHWDTSRHAGDGCALSQGRTGLFDSRAVQAGVAPLWATRNSQASEGSPLGEHSETVCLAPSLLHVANPESRFGGTLSVPTPNAVAHSQTHPHTPQAASVGRRVRFN